MKIGEVALRSGPHATLLRADWIDTEITAADSRHCDYDDFILTWIALLGRLKTTGMPIREMIVYADMVDAGDGTVPVVMPCW